MLKCCEGRYGLGQTVPIATILCSIPWKINFYFLKISYKPFWVSAAVFFIESSNEVKDCEEAVPSINVPLARPEGPTESMNLL